VPYECAQACPRSGVESLSAVDDFEAFAQMLRRRERPNVMVAARESGAL
jgi:hypothetical protein